MRGMLHRRFRVWTQITTEISEMFSRLSEAGRGIRVLDAGTESEREMGEGREDEGRIRSFRGSFSEFRYDANADSTQEELTVISKYSRHVGGLKSSC